MDMSQVLTRNQRIEPLKPTLVRKPPRLLFGLFVGLACVELGVPASMIARRELTLRTGTAYEFRTAAVDPYDAFRGRYVALQLEQQSAPWKDAQPPARNQSVFVTVERGDDGFARLTGASRQRPATGDYLRTRAMSAGQPGTVTVALPFDRFYMEETKAAAAERAYWEHSRQGGARDAYVVVRVRDGQGVIENLCVAGKPIAEFVGQPRERR
jgi:uncharacterized membrane-anchored protein